MIKEIVLPFIVVSMFILGLIFAPGIMLFYSENDIKECYKPETDLSVVKYYECERAGLFKCFEYEEKERRISNEDTVRVKINEDCPGGYEDKGRVVESFSDVFGTIFGRAKQ